MKKEPILYLQKGRERSVMNQHPWVFSGAIQKIAGSPKSGDVVQVSDSRGERLGYGHYQGDASIACRMFAFGKDPRTIDASFWNHKMSQALSYRRRMGFGQSLTEGYRLFFSEGDVLPGVVCDVFGNVASLQMKTQGAENLQPLIVDFLKNTVGVNHVFHKIESEKGGGEWLLGSKPEASFIEQGISFDVEVETGQKTGYFLDQRDNRRLVGHYAKDRAVLDAFSYSGGFSAFAAAGGAKSVCSVDISADATKMCEKIMKKNFPAYNAYTGVTADCFEYLRGMSDGQYDLIVLDPPAFSKSAASVERAARGYKEINLWAMRQIAPGGLLFTFSCSQHISRDLFRKIIFGAAKDAGRFVRITHQLSQSPDHPVNIYHPEGEYLKGLVLQVE